MTSGLRTGVDIGGTFTDCVVVDATGAIRVHKVPTTSAALQEGFLTSIDQLLERDDLNPRDLEVVAHATTVATNTIIEGKGARVALVVTEGFRDVFEIARQIRPDLFDLLRQKPEPLVSRDRVFEIEERIGPKGEVLRPLNPDSVSRAARRIADSDASAVVICLLHSHVNPTHERQVAELFKELLPGLDVSASSEIWPEFREYFRASTTVINAMIRPVMRSYLGEVRAGLDSRDVDAPLWIMQSGGGVFSEQAASDLPVHLIESGPAAGLTFAAYLGKLLGEQNIVSFEVGGTTAKVGLVVDGVPALTTTFEVGAMAATGGMSRKGTGYPIRTPVLDLVEVGAGGGSIAWVDEAGVLRVGPASAGAEPGPACYLRGGELPTLTDANLVLGRIDPDRFLGGEMRLSRKAAVDAIENHCAGPLSMETLEVAEAIVDIATAEMARALRLMTVERGNDPADFTLLAFGGAGPLHAAALAKQVGFGDVLIPPHPGVLSAIGLLVAPIEVSEVRTLVGPFDSQVVDLDASLADLARKATTGVIKQGVEPSNIEVRFSLDLRYRGQSFELEVPLGDAATVDVDDVSSRFHEAHRRAYGHATPGESIEIVNVRARARNRDDWSLTLPTLGLGNEDPVPVETKGSAVYERSDLLSGDRASGPAIIAEAHSTTFVPPGHTFLVDRLGGLRIARIGSS